MPRPVILSDLEVKAESPNDLSLRQPFITGSRVYGMPHDESDIDLVIRCSGYVADRLRYTLQSPEESKTSAPLSSVISGKLNLILCVTDNEYDAWYEGTKHLIGISPVSREEAIAVFKEVRKKHGVKHGPESE